MRKSNQVTFNFFGRIYFRFNLSISVVGFKIYAGDLVMHWIFYNFSLNWSFKLSFLTKPTFCYSFNESHFQAKITTFYYWFYWFE